MVNECGQRSEVISIFGSEVPPHINVSHHTSFIGNRKRAKTSNRTTSFQCKADI